MKPGEVWNLPNAITFARLCLVPIAIVLVLHRRFGWTLAVFVAAGLSDALDGFLARRRGGTALGAAMDPLADKALLVGMYVTLAVIGVLPGWIAVVVVFRDLLILGAVAVLWATGHPPRIRPLLLSKANTALQILLVALALLLAATGVQSPLLPAATLLVAASTLASLLAYVLRAARSR